MNNHLKFAFYVNIVQIIIYVLITIILIPLISIVLTFSGLIDIEALNASPEQYVSLIQNVYLVVFLITLFIASYFIFKILYKKFKKTKNLFLNKAILYSMILYIIINLMFVIPSEEKDYISFIMGILITLAAFYLAGKSVEKKLNN